MHIDDSNLLIKTAVESLPRIYASEKSIIERAKSNIEGIKTKITGMETEARIKLLRSRAIGTLRDIKLQVSNITEEPDLDAVYNFILSLAPAYEENFKAQLQIKVQKVNEKYKALLIDTKNRQYEVAVKSIEDIHAAYQKNIEPYQQVYKLQDDLRAYSEYINQLLDDNNLTNADCDGLLDGLEYEEIIEAFNEVSEYLNKSSNSMSLFKLLSKIKGFKQESIFLLSFFVLMMIPIISDAALIGFCIWYALSLLENKKNTKYLLMANALLMSLNVSKMIEDKFGTVESLPKQSNIDIDWKSPEVEKLLRDWGKELISLDYINEAKKRYDIWILEYQQSKELLAQKAKEFYDGLLKSKRELVLQLEDAIKAYQNEVDAFMSNIKLFPYNQSKSLVLSSKFVLSPSTDGLVDNFMTLTNQSIFINYTREQEAELAHFLRLLAVNYFHNVNYMSMQMKIVDPSLKGAWLTPMGASDELTNVITFEEDMSKALADIEINVSTNTRDLEGEVIDSYNSRAEAEGLSPMPYRVYFLLSGTDQLLGDNKFIDLLYASYRVGVILVVCTRNTEVEIDPKYVQVFGKPFDKVRERLPFSAADVKDYIEEYGLDFKKSRPKALFFNDFMGHLRDNTQRTVETFLKRPSKQTLEEYKKLNVIEEPWSLSPQSHIWIPVGLANGDKTKHVVMPLGLTGDVHALVAGGTGAGKSVLANAAIIGMAEMYDPKELRMVLIDGKGPEFSKYRKSKAFPYQLPHVDAVICTSDVAYVSTLLKSYTDEMVRRNKILADLKIKDALIFNNMVDQGNPKVAGMEKMPAIVIWIDEYVAFTRKDADPDHKAVFEQALLDFGNLSRSVHIHVVLSTQNFNGTLKENIMAQYSGRICLRVSDTATSNILLGSNAAANIIQKNGLLYVRGVSTNQQLIRAVTPFINDDEAIPMKDSTGKVIPDAYELSEVQKKIKGLDELAKSKGYHFPIPITYNEEDMYSIDTLKMFLDVNINKGNIFFLGESMIYNKDDRAPVYRILDRQYKAGSHMIALIENQLDQYNFLETILLNIKINSKKLTGKAGHVIMKACDITSNKILQISKRYDSFTKYSSFFNNKYADPNVSLGEFLDEGVAKIYEERAKQIAEGSPNAKVPIYILAVGWESAKEFLSLTSKSSTLDKIKDYLLKGDDLNIHFIFLSTRHIYVTDSKILDLCSTRICGKVSSTDTSLAVLKNSSAIKEFRIASGYAFVAYTDKVANRFKIYKAVNELEAVDSWQAVTEREGL